MKVGYLCARIDKPLTLSSDSEDAMKYKMIKKVKEELKALESKAAFLEKSKTPW